MFEERTEIKPPSMAASQTLVLWEDKKPSVQTVCLFVPEASGSKQENETQQQGRPLHIQFLKDIRLKFLLELLLAV